ncbi:MAG: MotA/TolQ/ExbB proton channel family protein [Phycisphaerales bacterium]|nr:MotA/TolQ/ExbB proton channel family protein [Phycisphaerales bacterium]
MIDAMLQFFFTGGWVMYPLLLMSILSLTLIFERVVFWFSAPRRSGIARLHHYAGLLTNRDRDRALSDSRDDRSVEGMLVRGTLAMSAHPTEPLAFSVIESIRPSIDRFSTVLSTIIAAAPLLGILGTVTGIIQSFDLLGETATVTDPSAVAGGIAQALYTTAFGLSVALITLFPHAYFRAKAEKALSRLETLASVLGGSIS